MNDSIVSMQKFTGYIVSACGNNRIRNASFLGSVIDSAEKVGLFARRINDLLSVT
jgi:hypothetical protein